MGTRITVRAGPRAAAAASAAVQNARTTSEPIITVQGRHRSLACPPKASAAVRGTP